MSSITIWIIILNLTAHAKRKVRDARYIIGPDTRDSVYIRQFDEVNIYLVLQSSDLNVGLR
ncbi:hypothetical protein WN55_10671 [Dufourea novaeangliae]|uniref:Uncharacterized protein n=1 Tax=Dufourea novaeangliae TaxID=178035 RepID=A0A154P9F2_DUFNO|nr:hypothetical protein WN55_10671 [Dufourea novaeangliae]